jgi:hypothetical protein
MISITTAPLPNCDPLSRPKNKEDRAIADADCSSLFAVPYFISFVSLCSFLVN